MKIQKAILETREATDQLPNVRLEMTNGKTGGLPFGFKRMFLEQGFVPVGFDLPEQTIAYPDGERVQFSGLVGDPEAAKALMVFGDYLDGNISLEDGQILYEAG